MLYAKMSSRTIEHREDRSGTIELATYASTGACILFFVARQVMKAIVFRRVSLDDLFIFLATVSWLFFYHLLSD